MIHKLVRDCGHAIGVGKASGGSSRLENALHETARNQCFNRTIRKNRVMSTGAPKTNMPKGHMQAPGHRLHSRALMPQILCHIFINYFSIL